MKYSLIIVFTILFSIFILFIISYISGDKKVIAFYKKTKFFYEDIINKYPNWDDKDKDFFRKNGKLFEWKTYNNGLKTFVFKVPLGGTSLLSEPFVKEKEKYYELDKKTLDKYFIPLKNTEDAEDYFNLLKDIKSLPELKTKLTKYNSIYKKENYKNGFFMEKFSKCLKNQDKVSNITTENDIYKIEKIYFNYEKKAFLLKIDYELDKNGNIKLKNEEILKDCGKGLSEGRDYIY